MHTRTRVFSKRFGIMALILIVFIVASAFSATASDHNVWLSRPNSRIRASTSANWSGYVAESSITSPANGYIISVKGNWVIPTLTCNASQNTYLALWVGIDGYSDGTVEQIGTAQNCVNGFEQTYAWIELYPSPPQIIRGIAVHDGDFFTASVTYNGANSFTLSIINLTTGQSYSQTVKASALRQSAEWIAEAPSSSSGILPLANFSIAYFSNAQFTDNTGKTYAIDGKGPGTYDAITIKDPNGGTAAPSKLTDIAYPQGPSSFTVAYGAQASPPPAQHGASGPGGGGRGAGLQILTLV